MYLEKSLWSHCFWWDDALEVQNNDSKFILHSFFLSGTPYSLILEIQNKQTNKKNDCIPQKKIVDGL